MNDNNVIDSSPPSESQDIEGYEEELLGLEEYPLDSLLIRYEPRTIHEVCRRIDKGQFILDPDFQRDFIWSLEKQCRLIESLIMRIPLPVFYLAERNDGKVIVVDGLQRFSTIHRYINNKFSLSHLDTQNKNLLGKKFSDLGPKLQTRIEDSNLILYLIDEKVPERAKLDIFERVNGGAPLTRQQMRNCIYVGPATSMLKRLSKNDHFINATGKSLDWKSMRDREFINRFFAFYLFGSVKYKGAMDPFLAETLLHINTLGSDELAALERQFIKSMKNNYIVFGKHAFRKHHNGQGYRNVINAALFDALSITIGKMSESIVTLNKEKLRETFFSLMLDEEFLTSITISTNMAKRVRARFAIADSAYKEFYDA